MVKLSIIHFLKVSRLSLKRQKDNIFSFVALIYPYPTKRQLLSFIAYVYDPLLSISLFPVYIFHLKGCADNIGMMY